MLLNRLVEGDGEVVGVGETEQEQVDGLILFVILSVNITSRGLSQSLYRKNLAHLELSTEHSNIYDEHTAALHRNKAPIIS